MIFCILAPMEPSLTYVLKGSTGNFTCMSIRIWFPILHVNFRSAHNSDASSPRHADSLRTKRKP